MRRGLRILTLVLCLAFSLRSFELELDGGWALIKPSDINLSVEFGKGWFYFFQESLEWGERAGLIKDLEQKQEEQFRVIKGGMFLEGRIKFHLGKGFALGAGLNHVGVSVASSPSAEFSYYSLIFNSAEKLSLRSTERLQASSSTPFLSLHFNVYHRSKMGAELWLAVGYAFAKALASFSFESLSEDNSGRWSRWNINLNQQGRARGPAFEVGGRLNLKLSRRIKVFIGVGYLRVKLGQIKGDGRYSLLMENSEGGSFSQNISCEDEIWYVGKVQFGSKAFYVSTNMPDFLSSVVREAGLDLSAPRFMLGLSLSI